MVDGFQIVDDFSSKVGWALEVVETIDANHREMVKRAGVRDIVEVLKEQANTVEVPHMENERM